MVYAGFWKRLAAAWIDYLVAMVIWTIFAFIYGAIYLDELVPSVLADGYTDPDEIVEEANFRGVVGGGYLLLFSLVIMWIYYSVFESSKRQATLGKLAVGIKVTGLRGNRIGFGRASGRYFGKFISTMIIGIGYLMAAFTKRKQGLHDMMAGCLVIRLDAATPDSNENREDNTVD